MVTLRLNDPTVRQFLKFLVVGVMNSLVTLVVIFICKSEILLNINEWVSNGIGYVAGVINSFVWNRQWVFKSKNGPMKEALKFGIGFLLCYGIQLLVTWFLTVRMYFGMMEWQLLGMTFTGYAVATLFGMCVYTISNFIYNRVVTFK